MRWMALVLLLPFTVLAIPTTIHQEGFLTNAQGIPHNGLTQLRFALYDQAEGGDGLWSEEHNLNLNEGYYDVILGAQIAFGPSLDGDPRFLGISVDGVEMLPRLLLSNVPYARIAEDVVGDINPRSIRIADQQIIDEQGNWVGPQIPGTNDGVGYDTPEEAIAAVKVVDGAGSGLDADLLDGLSSAAFVQGGEQVLALIIERDGGNSGLDADHLDGHDSNAFIRTAAQLITLLLTADGTDSGLDADLLDGHDSGEFMSATDPAVAAQILNFLLDVDGEGSGLDADRLDNLDNSAFMRSTDPATAVQVLNLLLTVDGANSGLDADLLDGLQASKFMRVDQDTGTSGNLDVGGSFSSNGGQFAETLIADRIDTEVLQAEVVRFTPLNNPPDNPEKGMLYFNGQNYELYVFDSNRWKPVGRIQGEGGLSCKDIFDRGALHGSGIYRIDPNENDGNDPFDVYCDMETAGGGWTMLLNLDTSDGHVMWWANPLWTNEETYGDVTTPLVGDHKSPAYMQLSEATSVLIMIHENGNIVGWKSFVKDGVGSLYSYMQGNDNTVLGSSVQDSDIANIWANERLVRTSTALFANHCLQHGGNCVTSNGGSPDGDRIGSHESDPSNNNGGGLGNWHDMNYCCSGQTYAGHECNGSAFRTASEAQAGWTYNGQHGTFGTDSAGAMTGTQNNTNCGNANWAIANGINYDYAIFFR